MCHKILIKRVTMNYYIYPSPTAIFTSPTLLWKCSSGDIIRNVRNAIKLMILQLLVQVIVGKASGTNVTLPNSVQKTGFGDNFKLPIPIYRWPSAAAIAGTNNIDQYIELDQELQNKILHKFNKIDDNLQEFIKMLSADKNNELIEPKSTQTILSRIARSFPHAQRPQCTVTKDELIGLKNAIYNTLLNVTATPSNSNCELNDSTDTCNQALKLIQCGVNYLKDGFLKATENKASLDEVVKWKNAYNNLNEKFRKEFDHVSKSISQEYQHQLDTLKRDFQYLGKQLNSALQDLEEKITKLCISEISNKKVNSAISLYKAHFIGRKGNSKLSEIVRSAYNEYGNLKNVINIIVFISFIPSCDQQRIAFPILYDLMKTDDHLNSPEVLFFFKAVEPCMNSSSLKNDLVIRTSKIINAWVHKIRTGNYEEIIEILKENCGHIIDDYWDLIIETAYANNLNNAVNITNFIRNTPCINNVHKTLTALFKQMTKNNHLNSHQFIMLAYHIKIALDSVNNNIRLQSYPNAQQYYENEFQTLKNKLPTSIILLIWNGDKCYIKNKYWNEYLYSSGLMDHGTTYNKLCTWIPKNINSESYWKFTPQYNGRFFIIENTYRNQYIFVSTITDDENLETPLDNSFSLGFLATEIFSPSKDKTETRRRVFTGTPENTLPQSSWIITPKENGRHFTIKNIYYKEYLYASSLLDSETRRKVFTWMPGNPVIGNEWEIHC